MAERNQKCDDKVRTIVGLENILTAVGVAYLDTNMRDGSTILRSELHNNSVVKTRGSDLIIIWKHVIESDIGTISYQYTSTTADEVPEISVRCIAVFLRVGLHCDGTDNRHTRLFFCLHSHFVLEIPFL